MTIQGQILKALGDVSPEHQREVADQGVLEGRWTAEDVEAFFETLDAIPDSNPESKLPPDRPRRAPYNSRRKRQPRPRTAYARYVRRFSTGVLYDLRLSKGAINTLIHIISRCGKGRMFRQCTKWVAADLDCSTRTIQNHYRELEEAHFIVKSSPDNLGRTTIYLTPRCEVRPFKAKEAQTLTTYEDGAKKIAATDEINSKKDSTEAGGVTLSQKEEANSSEESPAASCGSAPQGSLPLGGRAASAAAPSGRRPETGRHRRGFSAGPKAFRDETARPLDAYLTNINLMIKAARPVGECTS